jgi:tRNA(adenine34) deaminase
MDIFTDEYFMRMALKEASKAFEEDEVPVGAVVVCNNTVVAKAHNMTERLNDATAHAEMLAITAATENLGSKYLNNCTLYVTLEPCVMCAGATAWAQVGKIVFAAKDPKKGYSRLNPSPLHPKTNIKNGILEEEASLLIKEYFKKKR